MNRPSPFLSPHAHSLLTRSKYNDLITRDLRLHSESFIIDFDKLEPSVITALSDHSYEVALDLLQPDIQRCYLSLHCKSACALYTEFFELLVWLSDCAEFIDLFERLSESGPSEKLVIMLRLFALVEFSLGRLYWEPQKHCANTMKSLLLAPELKKLLGPNCILVLELLFGPVNSMNLRNLFWHGFVSPCDIEEMGSAFFYFPFAIVLSIGKLLQYREFNTARPSRSSEFLLQQASLDCSNICSGVLLADLVAAHPAYITSFSAYFEFIDHLFSVNPIPYLDALCVILVCLSMILRCEFASAFDWLDGRYSSEERFFVTIDGILQFEAVDLIPHPATVTHFESFASSVNIHAMAVLCDILSAENGPRIRDRLSHGELWFSRSIQVVDNSCIFERVDHHFRNSAELLRSCLVSILESSSKLNQDSVVPHRWFPDYIPVFHPIGIFVLEVSQINSSLEEFLTLTNQKTDAFQCRFSLEFWFPSASLGFTFCQSIVIDQLWLMVSTWSLLKTDSPGVNWSLRPAAIVNRLNIVLLKYLNALQEMAKVVRRVYSRSDLSSRQLASKDRMETCIKNLGEYYCWLIQLTTLIWFYWLGGAAGSSIREKLDVLSSQVAPSVSRDRLIGRLDRTSDKLHMWIKKSKWESINSFFETFPSYFV
ncbi:hypothetical protein FBUS_00006 [Fasciolopsis buskii]|uniref:DUF4209 domain-containing protein n=1 Tax=Fasciolopsis buskii TaxID=27845 RepID=A0A8E0S475_9TREM|nr:hypothetical protein FBUS_00006 [Fasciolopsis buski]